MIVIIQAVAITVFIVLIVVNIALFITKDRE